MNETRIEALKAERAGLKAGCDPRRSVDRIAEIDRELATLEGALDSTPRSVLKNLTKR